MKPEFIFQLILAVLGLVGGTGGILSFVIQYKNSKREDNASTSEEWHKLYTTMADRLKAQETLNAELQREIESMREKLNDFSVELAGYKKYDAYIAELEAYTTDVLNVVQPLVTAESFKQLIDKRPKNASLSV